ncbi:hypothetical protein K0M31_001662 [Melipona bicolor]|uniref:Uncharacterized protein n=1 Tax=Melipona bicolor TaxID=60889 RepID=A0AA40GG70_9HYME|nr:hypothetical protein K0M31_001662 [Melipona bicolor]
MALIRRIIIDADVEATTQSQGLAATIRRGISVGWRLNYTGWMTQRETGTIAKMMARSSTMMEQWNV